MTRIWIRTALFPMTLLLAVELAAQDVVSTEAPATTDVLLAFLEIEPSDVYASSIPEALEGVVLVPPMSRVVGTLGRDEEFSTIVDSELGREEAVDWLATAYAARGWERRVVQQIGGFQPRRAPSPSQFCRGNELVFVYAHERDRGVRLNYHYYRDGLGTECRDESRQGPAWPLGKYDFPTLTPPEGSEQETKAMCSARFERAVGTWLSTDLTVGEVLEHYSLQLAEAGWLPVAACWDGPVAIKAWQIDVGAEEPLSGLLLVTRRGETTDVVLSAARGSGPPTPPPASLRQ